AGPGPFDETAARQAASVYGVQKIAVEQGLEQDCPDALIVRLSKVYGLAKGDGTLFDEMASRLLGDRDVDPPFDQIFNPTFVDDVVQGILALLAAGARGIVHLCAEPACRRRDLALGMADMLGVDPARVPVPPEATQTTPLRARRFRELTGLTPLAPLEGLQRMAKAHGARPKGRHQQETGCDAR
ncbi:MAG TPA: sugar nucleotide-binding protein, partial [Holophaga sp.]|nr:sugar nucleotide-binding protein [Holophaga sp.]